MEFRRVETVDEVFLYLEKYNNSATRSISDRVQNMKEYSEKLHKYAENYAVFLDGKEAGFFSFYNNDRAGRKAYLTLIAFRPEYQRMKLGSRTIQFICERCRDSRMKVLRLEVDKANESACCFYEKQGFHVVGKASGESYYMEREIV